MKHLLKNRSIWLIFVVSSFTSAALLFISEPLIGKLLLPLFGGSPAVWNTCVVFFQVLLLAGYGYVHWSITKLGLRRQAWVHLLICLLPLLALPITLPHWASTSVSGEVPVWQLLGILLVTIGGPFFVLATTGPLVQRWFAGTTHPQAAQPYFLYAAGNLGSFVALLSYPFIIEPNLSLSSQQKIWSVGYVIFVLLAAICAAILHLRPQPAKIARKLRSTTLTWRTRAMWVYVAFVPSSLMLGVTAHLTTDVAAMPLLWVLPLGIYLLTFVAAFSWRQPSRQLRSLMPVAGMGLFGSVLLMSLDLPFEAGFIMLFHLLTFAAIALVAHGRLAASRPDATRLTEFYLWVAAGGALGGLFNALIAPVIFHDAYEFPAVLFLALPIIATVPWHQFRQLPQQLPLFWSPRSHRALIAPFAIALIGYFLVVAVLNEMLPTAIIASSAEVYIVAGMALAYVIHRQLPSAFVAGMLVLLAMPIYDMYDTPRILTERTFYGVLKIQQDENRHILLHGVTEHGRQDMSPERRHEPLTYYHKDGPVGDIMRQCQAVNSCKQVGVIGLGTGTMAAYGRPGDQYTFYEIDPAIIRLAQDPAYFTYLQDSPADIRQVVGDGRLKLNDTPNHAYDVLVVDAFSSDAIPTHLVTREALALFTQKVSDNGVVALHISNRQLRLEPIVKAGTNSLGLPALIRSDTKGNESQDHLASEWVVIAKNEAAVQKLQETGQWKGLQGPDVRVWTDDYSNILDALFATQ